MNLGATLSGALLAVLARPSTWALALLGFLVRGGWLLVVAPIVVVPTPVGIANIVAPLIEDVAFGRRGAELAVLGAVTVAGLVVWLIGGGLLAAALEAEGSRVIAEEEGDRVERRPAAWRILGARLLTLAPLALGIAWAVVRIGGVGYRELTVPSDVSIPLAWRIVVGAPDAFGIVLLTWFFSEIVGAIAARRITLRDDGLRHALRAGLRQVRRTPAHTMAIGLASTVALVIAIGITALATSATWNALAATLSFGDPSLAAIALLVLFVGLFSGGLVLIGLTCAWRAAVWTLDMGGTFGGVDGTRSGD